MSRSNERESTTMIMSRNQAKKAMNSIILEHIGRICAMNSKSWQLAGLIDESFMAVKYKHPSLCPIN
jgi:hypothetical protein